MDNHIVLQDLKMHFPIKKNLMGKPIRVLKAVDGINLNIERGKVVGLVGESGCGKTTIGRSIVRIYKPTGGKIIYRSRDGVETDLAQLSLRAMKPFRRHVRMIFQDPFSSLNPRITVRDIIAEPLAIHHIKCDVEERVAELMKKVGLEPALMDRYPHEFSGGQRQRIGIARTLALSPDFIVCDEPVSALDVSVQAQVLNLLLDLKQEMGLTLLFVAHDLSVVEHISDTIVVMYVGKLVEVANAEDLLRQPLHPYTEALVSAIPAVGEKSRDRLHLEGDVPSPVNPPSGCVFHPRCRYATERCKTETPELADTGNGRRVACHLSGQLTLRGC